MDNPKIMFYYHHYGGLGHGTRILAVIKSIRKSIHSAKVMVVNSGLPQDFLKMDRFAKIIQLSPLVSDKGLFHGIKPESKENLKLVMNKRTKKLKDSIRLFNPDFLFIEHYPFGRDDLDKELSNFIGYARQQNTQIRIFSILRDLLCQKINMKELARRTKHFDGFFVLSDPLIFKIEEEFNLPDVVRKKIVYVGYAVLSSKKDLISKEKIRKQLGINSDTKLIVANIGGGIDGYDILKGMISLKKEIDKNDNYLFLLSTGPSMNEKDYEYIDRLRKKQKNILLTRFNPNLLDYINAADLSISMAGYNACINAVTTKTPTLVLPRNDAEQTRRAKKFSQLGYVRVLMQQDMKREVLLQEILRTLKFKPLQVNVNINGADFIAQFIQEYGKLEYVKIRLLIKCNCNCDMCTWVLGNKEREIPTDKVFELYKQFKILGVKHINFTGGEPTLRKDIIELIKKGKQNGFKVSISTNGNFDESFAKKLAEAGIDMIDFSIDSSIAKKHNSIRNANGCWERATANIKFLSKEFPKIEKSINFTVRKDNYREAANIVRLAGKLGVKKVALSMINIEDNPKKAVKELALDKSQLEEFYIEIAPSILKEALQLGIKVEVTPWFQELRELPYTSQALKLLLTPKKFLEILNNRITKKDINTTLLKNACPIISKNVRIDHLGNITPCCALDEVNLGLGNIYKNNFVNLWLHKKYANFRSLPCPHERCKEGRINCQKLIGL